MSKKFCKAKKNENKNLIGYKYKLDVSHSSPKTIKQLDNNLGAARWMYNKFLGDYKAALDAGEKPAIHTPAYYKTIEESNWLKNVDSSALANVQLHFNEAIRKFFNGTTRFPKFKSKHKHYDSYTTNNTNNNIKLLFKGNLVFLKLPKIKEPFMLVFHRPIPKDGIIKSVTISHEPNGQYYASILVATDHINCGHKIDHNNSIGLDMSLPKLYIDSNGNEANFHKAYKLMEHKLAVEQRKLSHMVYGSNNYKKQCKHIAKLHAKIKHQRIDMLHKISCALTNQYDIVGIEDLDLQAIQSALSFGKSVSDNGWGMFIRMLDYKSKKKGKELIKVDKWFPSSKTCCKCGHIHKELKLSDRQYVCPHCSHVMDRDHQAAINIKNEAVRIYLDRLDCPA